MIQPNDTVIAKDGMQRMKVIGRGDQHGKIIVWCELTDPKGQRTSRTFDESDLIKLQS